MIRLALCLFAVVASGCAHPRIVIDSAHRGRTIKFLHQQVTASGLKSGIMTCKIAKKGALKGCKAIPIEFKE